MTGNPHVLIVSTIADAATDEVVRRLTARDIPLNRINTEDYPFSRTLAIHPNKEPGNDWFVIGDEPVTRPTAVWYRRLRTPSKPEAMDEGIHTFCLQETRATLLGGIMDLGARWMSHPSAVWQAEFKPFQLWKAAEIGLPIPHTVITNDPPKIRQAFGDFDGRMIVKPARSGHVIRGGREFAIFTSQVLKEHLDYLESAKLSPAVYQELVPKASDVRVTIVGEKVFAAAIDSQSDPAAMIDWRQTNNPRLPHRPVALPDRVKDLLLHMMDELRLAFAAIDMIQTPAGEYVFLEINPSGQWLWLDDMLDLGISDAVAEWLASRATI
jgi:glutathione synthase/RimK-type ligase-like ATP-grasp enzyme